MADRQDIIPARSGIDKCWNWTDETSDQQIGMGFDCRGSLAPPPPASAGRVQDGGRAGRPPHQQRSARTAQGAESADRIRKNVLLVAVLNLLSFSALSG